MLAAPPEMLDNLLGQHSYNSISKFSGTVGQEKKRGTHIELSSILSAAEDIWPLTCSCKEDN